MQTPPPENRHVEADRDKQRVALSSLAAAVLLTLTKLVIGLLTNSLGILSEAAHSGLDLVAAAMTFWAVRVSSRPADRRHTYGHGKVENLSALGETGLLLVTCAWIIYEAFHRLLSAAEVRVDANVWAFLVVVMSIGVDYSRSRALLRAAKKYQSQALEADALHFSTDIWSSTVVLFGLAGVVLGRYLGMPWLASADCVAALGVAAIVIGVSVTLGKKSIDDLLDTIPHDLQEEVAAAAAAVPGVEEVRQVRVRKSGAEIFADVTLTVQHTASFEKTHTIADQAEAAVRGLLPGADVVVHLEPVAGSEEDLLTTVRVLAARHGLFSHGVRIYEEHNQRSVELHLEVSESLLLEEAHRQVSLFEEDLRRTVPGLARITSHIEPAGEAMATVPAEPAGEATIREAIRDFFAGHAVAVSPHDVTVQRTGNELAVSLHCLLDADTTITAAHGLTEQLEKHLRARVPDVGRVVIHVEPEEGP
jgi:cation diffusion facilitator family transporter